MKRHLLLAKFFDQLFYKAYIWQLGQWNDPGIAVSGAAVNVATLTGLNLITILNLLSVTMQSASFVLFAKPKLAALVIAITWVLGIYRLYIARADHLITQFGSGEARVPRCSSVCIGLYMVVTVLGFFGSIVAAALLIP